MSKSNQRKINCFHESGHAVQAWVEGARIIEIRLVPTHEQGQYAATTLTDSPGPNPDNWTVDDIFTQMRITLAGTEGDQRGPLPVTAIERRFQAWEFEQHLAQAIQYATQFGAGRIEHDAIPILAASVEQDVAAVFQNPCVTRCVEALARELLRREAIPGPDAEAFIASRITEEQRTAIRQECCLTKAETMQKIIHCGMNNNLQGNWEKSVLNIQQD